MTSPYKSLKYLPILAASAWATASFPAKPADLTTPVQQRIAVNGPTSEFRFLQMPKPTRTSQNHRYIFWWVCCANLIVFLTTQKALL